MLVPNKQKETILSQATDCYLMESLISRKKSDISHQLLLSHVILTINHINHCINV